MASSLGPVEADGQLQKQNKRDEGTIYSLDLLEVYQSFTE